MCLNELAKQRGLAGFRHEAQSVRIVTVLEPLNLTQAVVFGMEDQLSTNPPRSLEGQLVKITDRMTYLHHDVEGATRAGLMAEDHLPDDLCNVLGKRRTERLDRMMLDLVATTQGLWQQGERKVALSLPIETAMNRLRKWMFDHVYLSPKQLAQQIKVQRVLTGLYEWYNTHPEALPTWFLVNGTEAELKNTPWLLDFLAGMTDRYAIEQAQALLLPTPHRGALQSGL